MSRIVRAVSLLAAAGMLAACTSSGSTSVSTRSPSAPAVLNEGN